MPENEPPTPPEAPTEQEIEKPELYTEEWYHKVNKQFEDLGEFIRSGKATHTAATESQGAPPSAATGERQPTPREEAGSAVGEASTARDTRPPKANHLWFRRLGE